MARQPTAPARAQPWPRWRGVLEQAVGWRRLSLHTRLAWAGFLFVVPALLHLIAFKLYPMLEAFDAPNPQESCSRRFSSIIPTQALMLMNDPLVLEWSRALAARVLNDAGLSLEQQVERAYRIVLSRGPSTAEQSEVMDFLRRQSALLSDQRAAFVDFCHSLLNSNEFVYVD